MRIEVLLNQSLMKLSDRPIEELEGKCKVLTGFSGETFNFSHAEGNLTYVRGKTFEISTYDGIDEKSVDLDITQVKQLIPVLQKWVDTMGECYLDEVDTVRPKPRTVEEIKADIPKYDDNGYFEANKEVLEKILYGEDEEITFEILPPPITDLAFEHETAEQFDNRFASKYPLMMSRLKLKG